MVHWEGCSILSVVFLLKCMAESRGNVVQSPSCVWLFVTTWTAAGQTSLSFTISWNLLIFMFIDLMMLCNHLIFCHPLLLLPSVFPSIRIFSSQSWLFSGGQNIGASVSASILPTPSWLISFRIDWFDLLSKGLSRVFSSTIQKHQFFGTQPSLWCNSHIHTWLLEKP